MSVYNHKTGMNRSLLYEKLIAAARSHKPSDHVPYAFEQRILSRLRSAPEIDAYTVWNTVLWRAAACCLAIATALSAWTYYNEATMSPQLSMSDDLAHTVVAAIGTVGETW